MPSKLGIPLDVFLSILIHFIVLLNVYLICIPKKVRNFWAKKAIIRWTFALDEPFKPCNCFHILWTAGIFTAFIYYEGAQKYTIQMLFKKIIGIVFEFRSNYLFLALRNRILRHKNYVKQEYWPIIIDWSISENYWSTDSLGLQNFSSKIISFLLSFIFFIDKRNYWKYTNRTN